MPKMIYCFKLLIVCSFFNVLMQYKNRIAIMKTEYTLTKADIIDTKTPTDITIILDLVKYLLS